MLLEILLTIDPTIVLNANLLPPYSKNKIKNAAFTNAAFPPKGCLKSCLGSVVPGARERGWETPYAQIYKPLTISKEHTV